MFFNVIFINNLKAIMLMGVIIYIPAADNIFRLCVFVKIFLTRVYGSAVL